MRPAQEFSATIGANGLQGLGASGAKGTFIGTDISFSILGERRATALAGGAHFQCHLDVLLRMLTAYSPADMPGSRGITLHLAYLPSLAVLVGEAHDRSGRLPVA